MKYVLILLASLARKSRPVSGTTHKSFMVDVPSIVVKFLPWKHVVTS